MPLRRAGFTLLELLIVISIVGILAAVMLGSAAPGPLEQLRAASQLFSGDVAYARSLAVANGSTYRLTFDLAQNRYLLTHSGANPAFNTLPKAWWNNSNATPTQHVVNLADLPGSGPDVRLYAAVAESGTPTAVSDVEFGVLGQTTRAADTVVWLAAGRGANVRYLSIRINPTTGHTVSETPRAAAPTLPTGAATADAVDVQAVLTRS